ncbi:MAG: hypothetical protein JJU45_17375 [Acidimicrobiia bacterium]|nr:hypothetical protein [Acidimicrobiia bacterium]
MGASADLPEATPPGASWRAEDHRSVVLDGDPPADGTDIGSTASLFAAMWAIAHILHVWYKGGGEPQESFSEFLLVPVLVAALALLARPSSSNRLVLLAVVQLVTFGLQVPFVANHWLIAAFVNAGIVVAFGARIVRGVRGSHGTGAPLLVDFAGYGRVVFLVSYAAAALAKLNESFFDPAVSCARTTLEPVAEAFGFAVPDAGTSAATALVWSVAAIELVIPVLLLIPAARPWGVALAVVFHTALAATPIVLVMDFTAYLAALLVLFLPVGTARRLSELSGGATRPTRWDGAVAWCRSMSRRPPIRLVALAVLAGLVLGRGAVFGGAAWVGLTWMAILLYGAVLVAAMVVVLRRLPPRAQREGLPGAGSRVSIGQWLLVGLLVLNAASPYMGGKTTSSFTMFSNLVTQQGQANHFFIPRVELWTGQDQLLKVLESSNEALQEVADDDLLITRHELRRQLSADPTASVVFVEDGERVELDVAAERVDLVTMSWAARTFVHHRSVPADGVITCTW